MQHISSIFRREWKEILKNRTLLQTMVLMPILLVALPTGVILFMNSVVLDFAEKNRAPEVVSKFGTISGADNTTVLAGLITLCFTFFLPLPAVLPMTIASSSLVNEKEKRSLEPLLATPVKTSEILWGKSLSAIVPAIILTWVSFILLVLVLGLILNRNVITKLDLPLWFAIIGLWTPALATWTTLVGVAISSRAKDARAATQAGSFMVIPILALIIGMGTGVVVINWAVFGIGLILWLMAVAVAYYIANQLFDRETILTRWK
jgi:ABC-2 type transport system permease protein